ncbi:MAG: ABC transporter ATP-binding protein/permease [Candidatus Gastranaerophilales bacterium]|nr:ABC transporter ATP-binding protein/permease [Candidatus Gastranaerophilales bacterium]
MEEKKTFKEKFNENTFVKNYKRMWPFVKPYWKRALFAMIICIPLGCLDSVIAWALQPYMDNVLVAKNRSFLYTWGIPIIIVVFTAFQGLCQYLCDYLNAWVGSKVSLGLKKFLYNKLLHMETAYYDQNTSGDIMRKFCGDADTACAGLLENLKLFVTRGFSSLSLLCVLIYNSWELFVVAIVVLGGALSPLAFLRKRIEKAVNENVEAGSKLITKFNETYAGNKTIASYNLQNKLYNSFTNTVDEIFGRAMKIVQRTSIISPITYTVMSIGIATVIAFSNYLIVTGRISSGNFVSFLAALVMLYQPLKSLNNNLKDVQVSFMAIERIYLIIDREPVIYDKEDAIELNKAVTDISFENVNFEYIEDTPVLKNISFKTNYGQTIALVGNSGGGKTTIVNLLPRFYDVKSGSIKIDGVDIRNYTLESLRDNIAVVFQDNFLFHGSIKDNILLGKPDATDEEIHEALKCACLDDFVESLEDGLDSYIGERGTLLSGGQKKRVAIARANLKNAPIVILDEATSALDNKAEAVVQKAIDNLMQNRTVFVIAHRLSTVQNADRIMVVNDGEIVESGSHEELLNIENGAYKSLYNAQFKIADEAQPVV